MTKTNNTLTWRVGQLEKSVDSMDNRIDSLMENHIPHIQKEIIELKTRIDVLTAVNISAIILATLINKFL